MTAPASLPEVPALLPEPRELVLLGGVTELSEDVRLMTKDVAPLYRKSMRTILSSAGIRVVANKKRFIIEVHVDSPEGLDLSRVPKAVQSEFYELRLQDNTVLIRTTDQAGALWGTHTLAALYRLATPQGKLPNLLIRDWPSLQNRGLFIESKWGPDRMGKDDWSSLIDRMSALKMNRLGIGLYGSWCCQYEGKNTEFLMVPVPDQPDIKTPKTLKWYSPERKDWKEETYLPRMYTEDFLKDVVLYAKEKGITTIPFFNSLGHNTLLPRMVPAVSAKARNGSPTGSGYCLSAAATRQFVEKLYGSILERYFADGAPFFHIQMDEVYATRSNPAAPGNPVEPWCECKECRAKGREKALVDYVVWLVRMLTSKGVGKVVMWNDQLTRHMNLLGPDLVKALTAAGVQDRLVLHWWWYSNSELHESVHPSLGTRLGLSGWVAPMTCYFNWSRYSSRLRNIEMVMEMGHAEGADGAMAYAVHDPAWDDHEAILADYAWNCRGAGPLHREIEHWANANHGPYAPDVLAARQTLDDASACPALDPCYYYSYTYYADGKPYPRHYPEEALAKLGEMGWPKVRSQLEQAAAAARAIVTRLAPLTKPEAKALDRACLESLAGEAGRVVGLASAFAGLAAVKEALAAGAPEAAEKACRAAREGLLDGMAVAEQRKPKWLAPAVLRDLSVLLQYLDQLAADLTEVRKGKRKADAVRWFVPVPVNQEGWPKGG